MPPAPGNSLCFRKDESRIATSYRPGAFPIDDESVVAYMMHTAISILRLYVQNTGRQQLQMLQIQRFLADDWIEDAMFVIYRGIME